MISANNNQLRDRLIEQAKLFGAASTGIAQPSELVSFHALLYVD